MKRHSFIAAFVFFLLQTHVFGQSLVPYYSNGLWGLCDTNLNVVVKPAHFSIMPYYGYYLAKPDLRLNKDSSGVKTTLYSLRGRQLISLGYPAYPTWYITHEKPFFLFQKQEQGFYEFFDTAGNKLNEIEGYITHMEKYFFIYSTNNKTGIYFTSNHKKIMDAGFGNASVYPLDSDFVQVYKEGLMKYFNRWGQPVKLPYYWKIRWLGNGLFSGYRGERHYILNHTKVVKISFKLEWMYNFNEGLAVVRGNSSGSKKINDAGAKYGVVNKNYLLVVPLKFEMLSEFKNGLSMATINKRQGIIDKKGAYVLNPVYDQVELMKDSAGFNFYKCTSYHDDTAAWQYNGRWRQLAHYGMPGFLMQYPYEQAMPDEEYYKCRGNACVLVADNKTEFKYRYLYDDCSAIGDGLFRVLKKGKYGVVNAANKLIIPHTYDYITKTDSGRMIVLNSYLAAVISYSEQGPYDTVYTWGQYNNNYFSTIKELQFLSTTQNTYEIVNDSLYVLPAGYIQLTTHKGVKFELADNYYQYTIEGYLSGAPDGDTDLHRFFPFPAKIAGIFKYRQTADSSPVWPCTPVWISVWGMIDTAGNTIIPQQYNDISWRTTGRQYFHNNGKIFNDGIAAVMRGNKIGFADWAGNILIEPQYDLYEYNWCELPYELNVFKNNLAIVAKNGKVGVINNKNEIMIPFEFKEIYRSDYGIGFSCYSGKQHGQWYAIDTLTGLFTQNHPPYTRRVAYTIDSKKYCYQMKYSEAKQDYILLGLVDENGKEYFVE